MFKKKILKFKNLEVEIRELSVRQVYEMDEKLKGDDVKTLVAECSNLDDSEILALPMSVAGKIADEIIKLTYGDLGDEKGEPKK